MENNISVTQQTNYASIVGVLVLILNHFNVNIGNDEIMTVLGGVLAIGGIISNWYHRYQKGDLLVSGVRKV